MSYLYFKSSRDEYNNYCNHTDPGAKREQQTAQHTLGEPEEALFSVNSVLFLPPKREYCLRDNFYNTENHSAESQKKNVKIHFQSSVNFHPNFVDGINFSENTINTQALTEERTLLSYMPPNSLTITIIYRLSLTPKDSI